MQRQMFVHVRLEREGLLTLGALVLDRQIRVRPSQVIAQQGRACEGFRAVHTLEDVLFLGGGRCVCRKLWEQKWCCDCETMSTCLQVIVGTEINCAVTMTETMSATVQNASQLLLLETWCEKG